MENVPDWSLMNEAKFIYFLQNLNNTLYQHALQNGRLHNREKTQVAHATNI